MTKSINHTTALRRVEQAREQLALEYVGYLSSIDETDPAAWKSIIQAARAAGLDKETLCLELSCAWSTILRWEAGQTVPGPFARTGIKERLLGLLQQQVDQLKDAVVAAE
jgi:hypothetical protein